MRVLSSEETNTTGGTFSFPLQHRNQEVFELPESPVTFSPRRTRLSENDVILQQESLNPRVNIPSLELQREYRNVNVKLFVLSLALLSLALCGFFIGKSIKITSAEKYSEEIEFENEDYEFEVDELAEAVIRNMVAVLASTQFGDFALNFEGQFIPVFPSNAVGNIDISTILSTSAFILSNNGLKKLHENSFKHPELQDIGGRLSLQKLVVENNFLEEIPIDILNAEINNNLKIFSSESVGDGLRIGTLDLSQNKDLILDLTSNSLSSLIHLNIRDTNIYGTAERLAFASNSGFTIDSLQILIVGEDSKTKFPKEILSGNFWPNLLEMKLFAEKLEKLPDDFLIGLENSLTVLNFINLQRIKDFPNIIGNCLFLEKLEMPFVERFPRGALSNLVVLNLVRVSRKALDGFNNVSQLREHLGLIDTAALLFS
eukprot:snap_masked-scaffold_48-processed-gene-0.9-mRNA-1 protein AED:1.00 eAED:1.00 QI:0/0/0/0/1/1/2/0/429